MSNKPIRIAIQNKGRLRAGSLEFLRSLGVDLPNETGRLLCVTANNVAVEVVFVRHRDIPRYVQSGVAQYGIVGGNVLDEYEAAVAPLRQLDFGECRLVIAVPQDSPITTIQQLAGVRIATTYPNTLRKFLQNNNVTAEIVELNGSVELAPQLNLAEAICDLTQTGMTLQEHGLIPLTTILESSATLIAPNI